MTINYSQSSTVSVKDCSEGSVGKMMMCYEDFALSFCCTGVMLWWTSCERGLGRILDANYAKISSFPNHLFLSVMVEFKLVVVL